MPRTKQFWDVPDVPPYGAVLRQNREAKGWSQEELAERVEAILYPDGEGKFRQGMISNYELGKVQRPNPKISQAIDLALGLPVGTLEEAAGFGRGGKMRVQQASPPKGSRIIPPTDTKLIWLIDLIHEKVDDDKLETLGRLIEKVGDDPETLDRLAAVDLTVLHKMLDLLAHAPSQDEEQSRP